MIQYRYEDLEINMPELFAHWDPHSEKYARGDQFITALHTGWRVDEVVVAELCEDHWFANGTRCVMVYHFTLQRDDETMVMPVISTPYIERLLANSPLRISSSAEVKV
ncbi:MAG: hypothetical protein D6737_12725 [Chloroflexi bacterium]|nr:MAG: hypothetical protein D6737_12725 [Chloroflexota bacterium]